ncbi:hypothetical protein GCM10023238_32810 [Streptomyces heliomycini]
MHIHADAMPVGQAIRLGDVLFLRGLGGAGTDVAVAHAVLERLGFRKSEVREGSGGVTSVCSEVGSSHFFSGGYCFRQVSASDLVRVKVRMPVAKREVTL